MANLKNGCSYRNNGVGFNNIWCGKVTEEKVLGSICIIPEDNNEVNQIIMLFVPGGTDLKPNLDDAKQLWVYLPYEMMPQFLELYRLDGGYVLYNNGNFDFYTTRYAN
ncbi:hypothetical protein [Photobacterium kasasachensis]|uniref:hypothetical protein n=1 Tax=Photobacterium kasasachensis TaxID=2910240 RepID=UPI003D0B3E25